MQRTITDFDVKALGQVYHVETQNEIDTILYRIFDDRKYIFTISLNENAEWKLCELCDELRHADKHELLIKNIGEAIEGYIA